VTRVEIHQLCAALKERVTAQMQQAADPSIRNEILIDALYELDRSVLPHLGTPNNSREYLACQGEVLDLISFLAVLLVRGPLQERRGVAVLAELAEGCRDPLLAKKLAVYAQELLAKSTREQDENRARSWRTPAPLLLLGTAALLILFFGGQFVAQGRKAPRPQVAALVPEKIVEPAADQASAESPAATVNPAPKAVSEPQPKEESPRATDTREAAAGPAVSGSPAEQTTRVRIVDNQVVVPVTLKNGTETVHVELVLDTGATRSVIHEVLANRLQIDLRRTRESSSEVADGRVIRTRVARIDSLSVGPFAVAPAEVEFIAYSGGAKAGHDGLLGMDFLGKHRYQIDMEHELVRWF
jgi:hypothetical protein